MTQILYIRTSDHSDELADLFDECQTLAVPIDGESITSLVAWSKREKMLDGNQVYAVLIDLDGMDFGNAHILSTVQQLRAYSGAEIIFLANEKNEDYENLQNSLSCQFQVEDFFYKSDKNYITKLQSALQGENTPLARATTILQNYTEEISEEFRPYQVPTTTEISVAIVGSQSHIGTTTQLFLLYHLLQKLGHPAIRDPQQILTTLLKSFYEAESLEEGVHINDVVLCEQSVTGYNIYLEDMGVLSSENAHIAAQADITVLVIGTKPWEMAATAQALQVIRNATPHHLIVIASFTTQETAEMVKYIMGQIYPAPYYPDPWGDAPECPQLKKVLMSILKEQDYA